MANSSAACIHVFQARRAELPMFRSFSGRHYFCGHSPSWVLAAPARNRTPPPDSGHRTARCPVGWREGYWQHWCMVLTPCFSWRSAKTLGPQASGSSIQLQFLKVGAKAIVSLSIISPPTHDLRSPGQGWLVYTMPTKLFFLFLPWVVKNSAFIINKIMARVLHVVSCSLEYYA